MSKTSRRGKKYGWKPDLPDHRDKMYSAILPRWTMLPPSVDLEFLCPPVYDQGGLGSCTANSIVGAHQFNQIRQLIGGTSPQIAEVAADIAAAIAKSFIPSRLFVYYNERVIENTVNEDSGAMIRDGIKSVASQGVCQESDWGYDATKFTQKPSDECYTDAMNHQVVSYWRLAPNLRFLKTCLADGYPFVFGFTVYESFETEEVARTGIMPMPFFTESSMGGHAVMCVGYDDATQMFKIRNSWGTGWGKNGYFFMPYGYMINPNLVDDMWTIRSVEIG